MNSTAKLVAVAQAQEEQHQDEVAALHGKLRKVAEFAERMRLVSQCLQQQVPSQESLPGAVTHHLLAAQADLFAAVAVFAAPEVPGE